MVICVADRNMDLLVALLWSNDGLVCKASVDFHPFLCNLFSYNPPYLLENHSQNETTNEQSSKFL